MISHSLAVPFSYIQRPVKDPQSPNTIGISQHSPRRQTSIQVYEGIAPSPSMILIPKNVIMNNRAKVKYPKAPCCLLPGARYGFADDSGGRRPKEKFLLRPVRRCYAEETYAPIEESLWVFYRRCVSRLKIAMRHNALSIGWSIKAEVGGWIGNSVRREVFHWCIIECHRDSFIPSFFPSSFIQYSFALPAQLPGSQGCGPSSSSTRSRRAAGRDGRRPFPSSGWIGSFGPLAIVTTLGRRTRLRCMVVMLMTLLESLCDCLQNYLFRGL